MNKRLPGIPLADVLRAANGLVEARLIRNYALGGALAAIYYVEPFATYDADLFYIPVEDGLAAGIPAIYKQLRAQGWKIEHEHLLAKGFPVQFLAAQGLTEEAVTEALPMEYEGVPGRVFRAEHVIAIAASVGRHKDLARIEQMRREANLDKKRLEKILQRHKLRLPEL
jgi:hypothetical protein